MYGIIPGAGNGIEIGGPVNIAATGTGSDAITVVYDDYAFPLNQYTVSFPAANPNGDAIHLAPPAVPPAGFPAIQSPTGLQVGDLILLSNNVGYAVGEITGITPVGANTNDYICQRRPAEDQPDGGSQGKYQVHHGWRHDHREPDLGSHLFHRSSCRRDRTATPAHAPGQRPEASAGGG